MPSSSAKNSTLAFYEANATEYFNATKSLDVGEARRRFLRYVPEHAHLLDAGSGSGRDTRFFLELGHIVEAIDASPALAALSTRYTGVPTAVKEFSAVDTIEAYDGIWACASLLHIPHRELPDVVVRFRRALKEGGILYASFRHGDREATNADGRSFSDMNLDMARSLLESTGGLELVEAWIDVGPGAQGKDLEWFNMILRKVLG